MNDERTLRALWETAPASSDAFDPRRTDDLPEAARRYLGHALAPGARLAQAARLSMHGTIRLGDAWHRFEAEQVLRWDRGFVWRASVHKGVMPIVGSDRWLDGAGAMRWKLLGVVPLIKAEGPDITRSAAGRLHIESIWLPAVFLGPDVRWDEPDLAHARATLTVVMEYIDGESLAARIARRGPLSPSEVVALVEQACEALGEAHEHGVVHCDVKPENVLLVDAPKRRSGGPRLGTVFKKICVEPPPLPSKVAPGCPPAFDAWFLRACAPDPEARFQTAGALASALASALQDATHARPEGAAGAAKIVGSFAPTEPEEKRLPAHETPTIPIARPGQPRSCGPTS